MARPRSIASGHRPQRHKPPRGLQTAQPRAAHLGVRPQTARLPSGAGSSVRSPAGVATGRHSRWAAASGLCASPAPALRPSPAHLESSRAPLTESSAVRALERSLRALRRELPSSAPGEFRIESSRALLHESFRAPC
eukprot:10599108-Alexandrium_andersonii.AAC.1